MKNKKQFRQGDVLIECVAELPTGKKRRGPPILAHGEATGHAHAVADRTAVEVFDPAGQDSENMTRLFLKVTKKTVVKHQEHAPIPLAPGSYQVTRQREYSPEAIRNVAD